MFLIEMLNEHFPRPHQIFALNQHRMGRPIHVQIRDGQNDDNNNNDDDETKSVDSTPLATVTYEIICSPESLDSQGNVHSGCIATIYDNFSTYALGALEKYWAEFDPATQSLESYQPWFMEQIVPDIAVTRSLQVSHHRSIQLGEKVFLEVQLVNDALQSSAYTARMFDEQGRVYSVMTHDKVKTVFPPEASASVFTLSKM